MHLAPPLLPMQARTGPDPPDWPTSHPLANAPTTSATPWLTPSLPVTSGPFTSDHLCQLSNDTCCAFNAPSCGGGCATSALLMPREGYVYKPEQLTCTHHTAVRARAMCRTSFSNHAVLAVVLCLNHALCSPGWVLHPRVPCNGICLHRRMSAPFLTGAPSLLWSPWLLHWCG